MNLLTSIVGVAVSVGFLSGSFVTTALGQPKGSEPYYCERNTSMVCKYPDGGVGAHEGTEKAKFFTLVFFSVDNTYVIPGFTSVQSCTKAGEKHVKKGPQYAFFIGNSRPVFDCVETDIP